MVAKIKNDGNWTQPYHMSRTRFQFNPAGGSRYGFAVQRTTSGNNANFDQATLLSAACDKEPREEGWRSEM